MANVRKEDYEKIANIYNKAGDKAAMAYIEQTYGIKAPRGVLMRIKKSPGFSYDVENNKIIILKSSGEDIFMGIEELCNKTALSELSTTLTTSESNLKNITLEFLYRELMEEKLMELNKYIKLNRYSNTITIDKTALKMDGYQITIN